MCYACEVDRGTHQEVFDCAQQLVYVEQTFARPMQSHIMHATLVQVHLEPNKSVSAILKEQIDEAWRSINNV